MPKKKQPKTKPVKLLWILLTLATILAVICVLKTYQRSFSSPTLSELSAPKTGVFDFANQKLFLDDDNIFFFFKQLLFIAKMIFRQWKNYMEYLEKKGFSRNTQYLLKILNFIQDLINRRSL